jgi:hypothetical protein
MENFSLEQLGFIETNYEKIETVRVIFFTATPIHLRKTNYYNTMVNYIRQTLDKNEICYGQLKIDWSPELFNFIPRHNHYSYGKKTLYFHVFEYVMCDNFY